MEMDINMLTKCQYTICNFIEFTLTFERMLELQISYIPRLKID